MAKFMGVLITLSLVPVFVLGFFSYRSSRACIDAGIINRLKTINILKRNDIETWVTGSINALEILSKNPVFDDRFKTLVIGYDRSDKKNLETLRNIVRSYMDPVIHSRFYIEFMVIRTPDGCSVASTNPVDEGKFFEDRLFFIQGKMGTFVQNVNYSMTLRKPSMVVSTPLKDSTGKVYAVLAGRLDLDNLSRIMELSGGESKTEDTYLVNTFNFFVTESRFGKGYALKKSIHTDGVNKGLKGDSGVGFYDDYRGIPVIGAYTWIPERRMVLITEIERDEAFHLIQTLKKQTLVIALVIAVLAMGVSVATSRAMSRPIVSLVGHIQAVGRGNLNVEAFSDRKDEIGALINAFGLMARQLRDTLVSKKRLEDEVVEREKVQKELRFALKDLERSNQNLEQFAYVASHDLQEPLRMVSSYCELLRDRYESLLDEKGRKYVFFAVDGASRMQKLINGLLDFSRVTRKGSAFTTFSARSAVDMALRNLETAIGESRAVITCDPLPDVTADMLQLTQLFQNLIGNSIKFRTEDPPEIHVSSTEMEHGVRFSVRDNGIGIDPGYKDKIFVIFQRLHSRTEYPGTGIGLALCKRIVERHGGTIWFEPAEGQGTTLYFTIGQGDRDYG
jgi:signal transduction histidine kinase